MAPSFTQPANRLDSDQPWRGSLELGEGWAIWRGSAGDNRLHRHFAAQAILSDAPVKVLDSTGQQHTAAVTLIEPLAPHRLLPAPALCLVFIEPRRHALARLPAAIKLSLQAALRGHPPVLDATTMPSFWTQPLTALFAPSTEADWEDQVRERIDTALLSGRVELAEIANPFHLSTERFRHVFAQRIGMPFKRYALWRRLHLAAGLLQSGGDVTASAHAAGFADAAHLGRTLKANFGVSASLLLPA